MRTSVIPRINVEDGSFFSTTILHNWNLFSLQEQTWVSGAITQGPVSGHLSTVIS